MLLSKISNIFIGLLKSRLEESNNKSFNYYLIDYSAIENNSINFNNLIPFNSKDKFSQDIILKPGDVLVKLFPPISLVYVDEITHKCVPLSRFGVIRCNQDINSKVVFYLLNQKLNKINKDLQGATTLTINISFLKNIDINYNESKRLVNATELFFKFNKIKSLLDKKKELIEKKQKYYGGKYE